MTTDARVPGQGGLERLGAALRDAVARLETTPALDRPAAAARALAAPLLGEPRVAALLRGAPIGHAAHPLLTDLPIGLWVSSTALDLLAPVAGHRAADRLLGMGVLAVAPTALTGLVDWATTEVRDPAVRRVGVAHAALNVVATTLYGTSWLLRRRGRRTAGVAVALVAGSVLGASGYLGGHMTVVRHAPHSDPVEPGRSAAESLAD